MKKNCSYTTLSGIELTNAVLDVHSISFQYGVLVAEGVVFASQKAMDAGKEPVVVLSVSAEYTADPEQENIVTDALALFLRLEGFSSDNIIDNGVANRTVDRAKLLGQEAADAIKAAEALKAQVAAERQIMKETEAAIEAKKAEAAKNMM